MAFTNLSLNIQPLLETTFISDMRLIINANEAVLKGRIESIVNTLEIDLVNKYIGVDNYINQVKTNNVILGNGISFMDSTTTIASLTKSAGKSILSLDQIVIQPGGSIDASGAADTVVVARLGVGVPLSAMTSNGFQVGSASTSGTSTFYGPVNFAKQAVVNSTETASLNTQVSTVTASLTGGVTGYYGELKLTATSKQFIYLRILAPSGATPTSANPIYLGIYEDPTSMPLPGQSFTIIIKDYVTSTGTAVSLANWGAISLIPGFDASSGSTKTIGVINVGTSGTSSSAATFINALGTATQYVQPYSGTSGTAGSTTMSKILSSTITFTKYQNTGGKAQYIITASHNAKLIN